MAKKKKTVRRATTKKVEITWHFFVPSAVAGIIACLFSESLTLGIQVFIVTAVATWAIRKYGQN